MPETPVTLKVKYTDDSVETYTSVTGIDETNNTKLKFHGTKDGEAANRTIVLANVKSYWIPDP